MHSQIVRPGAGPRRSEKLELEAPHQGIQATIGDGRWTLRIHNWCNLRCKFHRSLLPHAAAHIGEQQSPLLLATATRNGILGWVREVAVGVFPLRVPHDDTFAVVTRHLGHPRMNLFTDAL